MSLTVSRSAPMVEGLVAELEQESASTRRLLERLPEEHLGWRPHPKSMSLGQLGLHLAIIAPGVSAMAMEDEMDMPQFGQPQPASRAEILETFDQGVRECGERLRTLDDTKLAAPWRLVKDGQALMTLPRGALLRSILLNQTYHHRGQLTVYLRQLDVPLPPIYGPTADESPF